MSLDVEWCPQVSFVGKTQGAGTKVVQTALSRDFEGATWKLRAHKWEMRSAVSWQLGIAPLDGRE